MNLCTSVNITFYKTNRTVASIPRKIFVCGKFSQSANPTMLQRYVLKFTFQNGDCYGTHKIFRSKLRRDIDYPRERKEHQKFGKMTFIIFKLGLGGQLKRLFSCRNHLEKKHSFAIRFRRLTLSSNWPKQCPMSSNLGLYS